MNLIAIDPGTIESAYVNYNTVSKRADSFKKVPNDILISILSRTSKTDIALIAIEMIASYGMPVGKEVFETVLWIGRFMQFALSKGINVRLIYRKDVKMHLCNSTRAKDGNIRQAIIDRYGATRRRAIGLKKTPGPLYGFAGDVWAAMGVAITAAETAEE